MSESGELGFCIPETAGTSPSTFVFPMSRQQQRMCRLVTVHNWVETVYKAFKQAIPTGANEIALLAVREAVLMSRLPPVQPEPEVPKDSKAKAGTKPKPAPNPEDEIGARERGAASGINPSVAYEQVPRIEDMESAVTRYDDLLFCVWTDKTPHRNQMVEVFQVSVDPGDHAAGSHLPLQCEGQLYRAYPGAHGSHKGHVALHLYTDKKGEVLLVRNAKENSRTLTQIESAYTTYRDHKDLPESEWWKFCKVETNDTIHVHFSGTSETITRSPRTGKIWSEGCTVLRHGINSERYKRFQTLFNQAANKNEIPYLVVSSRYVKLHAEWSQEVSVLQENPPPLQHVMKMQSLNAETVQLEGETLYLPSIVSSSFANTVTRLAEALDALADDLSCGVEVSQLVRELVVTYPGAGLTKAFQKWHLLPAPGAKDATKALGRRQPVEAAGKARKLASNLRESVRKCKLDVASEVLQSFPVSSTTPAQ